MKEVKAARIGPASAKMILNSKVDNVKEVHRKGEKKNWFQTYNDHTIIFDDGKEMTLDEATKYLGASIYIDEKNRLRYMSQVIVDSVDEYLQHTISINTFNTNVEAQSYFGVMTHDYNLQRL